MSRAPDTTTGGGPAARGGLFVVFEGVEGAGKSTQAALLGNWLEASGIPYVVTREPGGTRLGEEIRRLVLLGEDVPARTEALLLLAARAVHVEREILPALRGGKIVVGDRFELSTLAYQGGGRQLPELDLRRINEFATRGLRPDVTFVLDVPVTMGVERHAAARPGGDRIERAGRAFHERVAEAYRLLSTSEPGVEHVDANATAAEIHAAVVRSLKARFPETFARATG